MNRKPHIVTTTIANASLVLPVAVILLFSRLWPSHMKASSM